MHEGAPVIEGCGVSSVEGGGRPLTPDDDDGYLWGTITVKRSDGCGSSKGSRMHVRSAFL